MGLTKLVAPSQDKKMVNCVMSQKHLLCFVGVNLLISKYFAFTLSQPLILKLRKCVNFLLQTSDFKRERIFLSWIITKSALRWLFSCSLLVIVFGMKWIPQLGFKSGKMQYCTVSDMEWVLLLLYTVKVKCKSEATVLTWLPPKGTSQFGVLSSFDRSFC